MSRPSTFLMLAWVACAACGHEAERSTPAAQPAEQHPAPEPAPAPAAPPAELPSEASLLHGDLPKGPQAEVMLARCQICHTLEYVTQQRLTGAQWDKTLTKMQKWGSPLTDDEKKTLGPYLAATWRKDLPDRLSTRVPTPEGAVPAPAER